MNDTAISSLFIGATLFAYARRLSLPLDKFLTLSEARIQAKLALTTTRVLRLLLPKNRAPIIGDTELSPVWLTQLFRRKQIIPDDVSVTRVNLEFDKASGVNDGIAGAVMRFSVEYSSSDGNLPRAFILKRSPIRLIPNVVLAGQTREALFYNSSFATASDIIPQPIYSAASYFGGVVIIFEDLVRSAQGKGVNYILGNQVWGVPPEMQSDVQPLQALEEMFKFCATINAKNWNNPELLKCHWLKSARWYQGLDRASWEIAIDTTRRGWQICKTKLIPSGTVKFSEKLIGIVENSLAHTNWENFQRHVKDRSIPFTLTHGDFHAANMLWINPKNSSSPLRVVDWSEVGVWEPTTDLGQTIISDVSPEVWRGNDERLLRIYWDTLIANGVSGQEYPFEKCKSQYDRAGVERWIWTLCLLNLFDGIPPAAFQYFHDQILAFIEAHGDHPYYCINPVAVWV